MFVKLKDFTTSDEYPDYDRLEHFSNVFDIRYHQEFAIPQPIKKIKLKPPVDAAVKLSGFALLSINKVLSIITDG